MCEGLQQTPAEVTAAESVRNSPRTGDGRREAFSLAFSDCPTEVREVLALQHFIDGVRDPEIQKALRMADLKDLKGALVFAIKFEAAQQATRKDRHPIRAVNESDTSNSSVERLERQMRSFMNRVESLMSQKADGKKTLKCWTCGREGHLQRSCRARQGAETNKRLPEGGVGKLINDHLVGRRLPDFGKPHIPVCQISTKSTEKLIWTPPCVVLQNVTGEKIDIHGKLKVKIKFADATYQHAVYVADIADPFILGLDFLKENGFTLDFNKNELRSIHEEVTIFKIKHRTESIRQVTANENITIPPRTEIIVPGYIGNDVSFNSGIIGSAENKANGLLIASTLVDLSRKTIPLTPDLLENAELSPEQKSSAERLFQEFEDVFSRNSSDIGHTTVTQHRIDTADHPPIKQHQDACRSLNRKRIDDTLDTLSGHKWFSTLDLKSGYWQVEIHPEDREKQHSLPAKDYGSSKSCRSGLCNAPATFERLMETVLKGLTFEACLIYLDDVIIGGRTFEEHLQNIRKVLSKLSDANLKLNPSKCKFFQKEVNYLGHIISAEGVRTDPEKVSALKEALTSSPILIYPQPDKPFILDTDASNECRSSIISGNRWPGTSRSLLGKCLSKPERNYCVTRKELLAIVKAIEHFHHYLYGQKFLLRTDHASLTWLMNFRNTEGQVARWIQRLNEYYFDIRHRKGSSHGNADALSRRPCPENCRHCSRVETKYDYAIRQITTSTATPPDPWVTRKFEKTRWRILILNPL
ncbi:retrovirus-related Pol polyprotein from transposon 17.6 [Trichonephila clavipes]|nr:retrovirus-related Pol polyprotein from transposon 17.6 [Trichonephila clavipes]